LILLNENQNEIGTKKYSTNGVGYCRRGRKPELIPANGGLEKNRGNII